jgi:CRISPR system Cascade subunit CasA
LARALWFASDRESLILANGLEYPPFPEWREPSSTIVIREVKGQPDRVLLRCDVDKAAWRELHALTVMAVDNTSNGGPAALQNVSDLEAFDLWVGGLVASKAKPVDTTESVFHVPVGMLGEASQTIYQNGVREADRLAFRVRKAVSVYHREIGDNLDRPEMKNRRQQLQNKACAQFWTDVEGDVHCLLEVVSAPETLGVMEAWHNTTWGKSVRRAARAAYENACPHETPRQIRAWALGLSELVGAAGTPVEVGVGKEDEE